jgi:hypothetical protein
MLAEIPDLEWGAGATLNLSEMHTEDFRNRSIPSSIFLPMKQTRAAGPPVAEETGGAMVGWRGVADTLLVDLTP